MSYRHPVSPDANPQVVTLSVASAQSAAFGTTTKAIRLVSDVDCWIIIADNPTATTSGVYLPAKFPQLFGVSPGQKVAGIAGGAGHLYVTEAYSAL
jgi:hypothetical protein